MSSDYRYLYASIIHQASSAPTSCRMMLVIVDKEKDGEGRYAVCYYPVVAIQTVVETDYTKRVSKDSKEEAPHCVTHKELIEHGFHVGFRGRHEETRMLVVAGIDGEDDIYPIDEVVDRDWTLGHRVVCCWGDPTRDEGQARHVSTLIITGVRDDCGTSTAADVDFHVQGVAPVEEPASSNGN